jgi:hypothetical protein
MAKRARIATRPSAGVSVLQAATLVKDVSVSRKGVSRQSRFAGGMLRMLRQPECLTGGLPDWRTKWRACYLLCNLSSVPRRLRRLLSTAFSLCTETAFHHPHLLQVPL